MRKFKIYISSTFNDLSHVRDRLIKIINTELRAYLELTDVMEFMFEDGQNENSLDVCFRNIAEANVYIIIIGNRYGSIPTGFNLSYTELEFNKAIEVKKGKKILIYKIDLTESNFLKKETSDFDKPQKKDMFDAFYNKVFDGRNSFKPANEKEFNAVIGKIIIRSNLIFTQITQLNISPLVRLSINRQYQKEILQNMDFRSTGNRVFGINLGYDHYDNDDVIGFSKRIMHILNPSEEFYEIEWIDNNILATSFLSRKVEDWNDEILYRVSKNIFGSKADFLTFSNLGKMIDKNNIKTRYLGFKFEIPTFNDETKKEIILFSKIISSFIERLNMSLIDIDFIYTIKCIVAFKFNGEMYNYFQKIKFVEIDRYLGSLTHVNETDIENWLRENCDAINYTKEDGNIDVDKFIYEILDGELTFPASYRTCLDKIDQKTRI